MRWSLLLLFLVLGCCKKPDVEIRYVTQRVEVPVVTYLKCKKLSGPKLKTDLMTKETATPERVRALVQDVIQFRGYIQEVEAQYAPCTE